MKPFFSIVIPTYNQGNLLSKCLESVLFQSFRDFEIIVIDNNSTDTTNKIIKKFKKKIIYNIAKLCEVSLHSINVKAKTTEKLGVIGKEKAIAAEVIMSVIKYD